MDLRDVAVATMTWARDAHEESALREALGHLAEFELPIAVTDGGSTPSFLDFMRSLWRFEVTELEPPRGLVRQVQTSFEVARRFGTEYILYTEPDKTAFFRDHLLQFVESARTFPGVGVVLAARTAEAMASFPASQQRTETVFNELCADMLGVPTDYCYGPFLVHRSLARYIEAADASLGWGWRPFLFGLAARLQFPVTAIAGDYRCPPDQQQDSDLERLHRLAQLSQNVNGLVRSTEATGLRVGSG